jgi:rhamnosyltransferase
MQNATRNRKAFVIAHYNEAAQVSPDLFRLVAYLNKQRAKVVFVSTNLTDTHCKALSSHSTVIRRENFGYDFWSYKIGIDALGDLKHYDRVTLLNSSFLILSPPLLCEVFLSSPKTPAMRGLSMSHDKGKHLQSYWVAFETTQLLTSAYFKEWWNNMTPISERQSVIDTYEVGMTKYFEMNGIPIISVYEPTPTDLMLATFRMFARGRRKFETETRTLTISSLGAEKLNPTHFLWEKLLVECGIIKYELLKKNPEEIPLRAFYKLIKDSEDAKISLKLNSVNYPES